MTKKVQQFLFLSRNREADIRQRRDPAIRHEEFSRLRIREFGARRFLWREVNTVKKYFPIGLIAIACMIASGIHAKPLQQDKAPLRLIQTIPMPNVKGRIDHMEVD